MAKTRPLMRNRLALTLSALVAGWVVLQAIGILYGLLLSVIVERSR